MRTQMIALSSMAIVGMMVFGARAGSSPAAKIEFPRQRRTFVLPDGADLAGNCVVTVPAATPFTVLRDADIGDEIIVETKDGQTVTYRVRSICVIAQTNTAIQREFGDRRLTLIAAYPFNRELRYAVVAVSK